VASSLRQLTTATSCRSTSYKSKRAIKDLQDRQRLLDKVQKSIGKQGNPKKLIANQGVKKFVTVSEDATVVLDTNKIAQDAQWDGLHGIITNISDDTPQSLIARYAKLWMIEESFRVNKHTLQMRPIFHWVPPRIHAHIAICYMTFSVLRHLQYRINLTQKISIDTILDELMNVQASIYIHKKTKDRYRVPGSYSNNARKIYKSFDLQRSMDAAAYLP
jgi:transposase